MLKLGSSKIFWTFYNGRSCNVKELLNNLWKSSHESVHTNQTYKTQKPIPPPEVAASLEHLKRKTNIKPVEQQFLGVPRTCKLRSRLWRSTPWCSCCRSWKEQPKQMPHPTEPTSETKKNDYNCAFGNSWRDIQLIQLGFLLKIVLKKTIN